MFEARSKSRLIFLLACFVPTIGALLRAGAWLPFLGALLLGCALGAGVRPVAKTDEGAVLLQMLCIAVWTSDLLLFTDDTARRLLDVTTLAVNVVALWPDDPKDVLKRHVQTLRNVAKRWSTGIPLHS
ncbi:hypothetical protein MF271_24390 (plasmid) [Deinococcus sp. KNUC1210]|uniref:hypothetical protein n=1 Tax=Deinococcus sp. KNUC1210 TaxID=2917691 RepID=UPI001EEFA4F3|nr:hypothetical protein [Deinococcus sp. KNUC1210]ULH18097.1 hypothetical protein MF271_24390 [Deinococcus sp. KNUC1210]